MKKYATVIVALLACSLAGQACSYRNNIAFVKNRKAVVFEVKEKRQLAIITTPVIEVRRADALILPHVYRGEDRDEVRELRRQVERLAEKQVELLQRLTAPLK